MTVVSGSPEETRAFGALLARGLRAGDFIALDGELAAGKTCLVQGLAAGLGYPGRVTSPTFTLLHLYEGGRLPLYHFDVYRLCAPEELEGIGYEDYFYGDGVCVVEWSGRAENYLPARRIELRMEKTDERGKPESADWTEQPSRTAWADGPEKAGDGGRRRIIPTLHGGSETWRRRMAEEIARIAREMCGEA